MRKEIDIQALADEIFTSVMGELEWLTSREDETAPILNDKEQKVLRDKISEHLKEILSEVDYGFELDTSGENYGCYSYEEGDGEDQVTFLALHDIGYSISHMTADAIRNKDVDRDLFANVYSEICLDTEDILEDSLQGCENGISFKEPEKNQNNEIREL